MMVPPPPHTHQDRLPTLTCMMVPMASSWKGNSVTLCIGYSSGRPVLDKRGTSQDEDKGGGRCLGRKAGQVVKTEFESGGHLVHQDQAHGSTRSARSTPPPSDWDLVQVALDGPIDLPLDHGSGAVGKAMPHLSQGRGAQRVGQFPCTSMLQIQRTARHTRTWATLSFPHLGQTIPHTPGPVGVACGRSEESEGNEYVRFI